MHHIWVSFHKAFVLALLTMAERFSDWHTRSPCPKALGPTPSAVSLQKADLMARRDAINQILSSAIWEVLTFSVIFKMAEVCVKWPIRIVRWDVWKWMLLWGKCHMIRASRALLTSEFQFTFFSVGLDGHPAHFVKLADDWLTACLRVSAYRKCIYALFFSLFFSLHSSFKAYLCVHFRIQSHV